MVLGAATHTHTYTQGESMTMDNEHTSFWHAVLELKQQDRNTPKPPSTGGDWELLSPAKGASACGSSAHSEGDHEEGLHEDHVSEQHAASEVHEETVVDPLHPCKEPVDSQTVYVVQDSGKSVEGDDEFHALEKPSAAVDGLLGLTWLMSWISPPLACPTVSGINEYMQQVPQFLGGGNVLHVFCCKCYSTIINEQFVYHEQCLVNCTCDHHAVSCHLTTTTIPTGGGPRTHLCVP